MKRRVVILDSLEEKKNPFTRIPEWKQRTLDGDCEWIVIPRRVQLPKQLLNDLRKTRKGR